MILRDIIDFVWRCAHPVGNPFREVVMTKSSCLLAVVVLLGATVSSSAASRGHEQSREQNHDREMLTLAPEERIEQRCNARAMGVVGREHKGFRPDEMVAYAFADPVVGPDAIEAPGAALRSGGNWYRLSYHCTTSADGLQVLSFEYRLGDVVPRAEWADHMLVP
jgi:hypothetical protein